MGIRDRVYRGLFSDAQEEDRVDPVVGCLPDVDVPDPAMPGGHAFEQPHQGGAARRMRAAWPEGQHDGEHDGSDEGRPPEDVTRDRAGVGVPRKDVAEEGEYAIGEHENPWKVRRVWMRTCEMNLSSQSRRHNHFARPQPAVAGGGQPPRRASRLPNHFRIG